VSQVLTLFTTPVIYLAFDRVAEEVMVFLAGGLWPCLLFADGDQRLSVI
jgi:hypothetical protein